MLGPLYRGDEEDEEEEDYEEDEEDSEISDSDTNESENDSTETEDWDLDSKGQTSEPHNLLSRTYITRFNAFRFAPHH